LYQPTYKSTVAGEHMYEAFFTAQGVLNRYVKAYREATKMLIDIALREVGLGPSEFILDQSHNGVSKADIDSNESLVYRHNAVPLLKNEWAIVSGQYDHESYIVRGGKNTSLTHDTIDHGLGHLLGNDKSKVSNPEKTVQLKRFGNGIRSRLTEKEVSLTHSSFADSYINVMKDKGVIDKAVSLQPILNIKYN
jgi:hypothetical protein